MYLLGKNILKNFIFIFFILVSSSFAQTLDTKKESSNFVFLNENNPAGTAEDKVRERIENFAKTHNINFGIPQGNRFFTYGIYSFSIDKEGYERRKVVAFEKAYMDAMKEMAKTISTKITTETIRELKSVTPEEDFGNVSNLEVLKRKMLVLTDATLNKLLEKLGVSPEKIGKLSLEQKRNLFLDKLEKKIVTETLANLRGTLVYKTFEEIDKDGNCAVGVILFNSKKLQNLADAFAKNQIPPYRNPNKAKPIEAYLPKTKKEWLEAWGVQVIWDNKGYPALISYGQWGYPLVGPKYVLRRKDMIAERQANSLAEAYITQFINMDVLAREISRTGMEEKENEVLDINMKRIEDIDKIIEDFYEKTKTLSKAHIVGLTTLKRKRICYKIGNYPACTYIVVKLLSPQNVIKVNNYLNSKKETQKFQENKSDKNKEVKKKINTSPYIEESLEGPSNVDISDW